MSYPISSDGIIVPDDATGILLYKDGQLVTSIHSSYELTVPVNDEYDHMFVVSNGLAEETHLNDGGVVTVLSGGLADRTRVYAGTLEVLSGGKVTNLYHEDMTLVVSGGEVEGIR